MRLWLAIMLGVASGVYRSFRQPLPAPAEPYPYHDDREAFAASEAAGYGEYGDGDGSGNDVTPAPVVAQAPDPLVRATLQIEDRLEAERVVGPKAPQVTWAVCKETAKKTKALKCDLVTQISGTPEGCECQLVAKKCPAADKGLGFTGLSPGNPMTLPEMGDLTVILCMYWQWLPGAGNNADAIAEAAEKSKKMANQFVKAAYIHAEGVGPALADTLWAVTPSPFPTELPLVIPAEATLPPTTIPPTTTVAATTAAATTAAATTAAPTTAAATTAAATTAAATTAAATTAAATTAAATTAAATTAAATTAAATTAAATTVAATTAAAR